MCTPKAHPLLVRAYISGNMETNPVLLFFMFLNVNFHFEDID